VPAARILTVPQAVESEQLAHRSFFTDLPAPWPDGSTRRLRVSGSGVLFDGEPLHPTAPPPRLGQHNAEVPHLVDTWRTQRPEEVTP
jgi:crotonobetainyl-CoA:carnitine CoA-transferase CaiB-like acyl-CoA transferase